MNAKLRRRRQRFAIAAVAAAALGAIALGLLVMTRGVSSNHGRTPAADPQQAALAYARCMRKNGLPEFPDPDPNGQFSGLSHEQQNTPTFLAAQQACRSLAPGGEHENLGDPAFVNQMRSFSQCMRENGLPDFPDPDAQGRLRGEGHEQQNDPTYQAAFEVCRDKLPGGGQHQ
jgi:hypothetical protein